MSITTLAPDTRLSDGGTDDEDGVAHYAKRSDIMQSAIEGTVITALCGYKLRQRKDGDDMPKCQKCVALLYALI